MKRLAWFAILSLVLSGIAGAAELEIGSGSLHVELRPDRGRAVKLHREGPHRWSFRGSTQALVGESYRLELSNRSSHRLKVVIGVDGLNVYHRRPITGRADSDVGSVLGPWERRQLEGWQVDDSLAHRFVFSPVEWSEGLGMTDSEIGRITVQVYREEEEPRRSAERLRKRELKSRDEAQARAPEAAPAIGTTGGEDVTQHVRWVNFRPRTSFPEAWAEIEYGMPSVARPAEKPGKALLGLWVRPDRAGLRIVEVEKGSRADRAGLEPSDVIVKVDTRFGPDFSTLQRIVREKDRGDYLFLRVRRGADEIALKLRC